MALWSRFLGSSISTGAGFGIGAALGPTLAPYTQEIANKAWESNPEKPVAASIAAELAQRGLLDDGPAKAEAARTGYDATRFARLVNAASEAPSIGQLFEMANRGNLDDDWIKEGLQQNRIRGQWRDRLVGLRRVLPPVTDLVRFGVREVFNPQQRAFLRLDEDFPDDILPHSRALGLSDEDTHRYWQAHWDLPSYTQAADMLHRKIIEPDQFDALLKALDYSPTWRDRLKELAKRIPPISDLIRFSVREVYQDATAAKYGYDADYPQGFTADAALHGMDADRAKQYWRAHWRLPSARQGYEMRRRKLIGDPELDDLLRLLDYPEYWRDRLMDMRFLIPGRIDLRRMLAAGIKTRAEVKDGYQKLGYDVADAEDLTQLAERGTAGTVNAKDLTLSHWSDEYLGGYITEGQFRSHLADLGYNGAEQDELVRLYDARKVKQARDRAVAKIAAQYIGYGITKAEATALLQRTTVRPEARARIMDEWDIAREANVKQMTASQVRTAFKKALRSRDWALAELAERGWRTDDANTFLDSA